MGLFGYSSDDISPSRKQGRFTAAADLGEAEAGDGLSSQSLIWWCVPGLFRNLQLLAAGIGDAYLPTTPRL